MLDHLGSPIGRRGLSKGILHIILNHRSSLVSERRVPPLSAAADYARLALAELVRDVDISPLYSYIPRPLGQTPSQVRLDAAKPEEVRSSLASSGP